MALTLLDTAAEQRLRPLCGLTPTALDALLQAAIPVLLERRRAAQARRPRRQRAVGGGRRRTLSPAQELLLTLIYLRHNVAHAVVGALFGVSADTSENTFHEGVTVLQEVCPSQRWDAEKRWQKGEPSWRSEAQDRLLVDSFETPVARPSQDAAQRRVYSGKKKRHTLKTQIVTDDEGEIVEVSAGHRGPAADKTIYEDSGVAARYPRAAIYGDRSYLKATRVQVPHRRPRGGELTPEQKAENRRLSQIRIAVEHSIRRVKAFRILRENYRLALGLFPKIVRVVVGLVQLNRLIASPSN